MVAGQDGIGKVPIDLCALVQNISMWSKDVLPLADRWITWRCIGRGVVLLTDVIAIQVGVMQFRVHAVVVTAVLNDLPGLIVDVDLLLLLLLLLLVHLDGLQLGGRGDYATRRSSVAIRVHVIARHGNGLSIPVEDRGMLSPLIAVIL